MSFVSDPATGVRPACAAEVAASRRRGRPHPWAWDSAAHSPAAPKQGSRPRTDKAERRSRLQNDALVSPLRYGRRAPAWAQRGHYRDRGYSCQLDQRRNDDRLGAIESLVARTLSISFAGTCRRSDGRRSRRHEAEPPRLLRIRRLAPGITHPCRLPPRPLRLARGSTEELEPSKRRAGSNETEGIRERNNRNVARHACRKPPSSSANALRQRWHRACSDPPFMRMRVWGGWCR